MQINLNVTITLTDEFDGDAAKEEIIEGLSEYLDNLAEEEPAVGTVGMQSSYICGAKQ